MVDAAMNHYRIGLFHSHVRRRFREEVAFLLRPHPNIAIPLVNVYETYNITAGPTAVVSVPVPKETLYGLLRYHPGSIQPDLILSDIVSAVTHLHQIPNRWHGSLSPEIIEIKDGRAIINEYGYYLSHDDYYRPHPSHLAPEVLDLSQKPDRSVDSYAFGIIMIELYSGHLAFDLEEPNDIINKVMQGDLPPIPSNMPEGHAALCRRCISRNTMERPSMEEIKLYLSGQPL